MIPAAVVAWLAEQGHGVVQSDQPVAGGCISNGTRLQTSTGAGFFLKTNRSAPADMFAREADGLAALQVKGGPRLPQVFLVGVDFLLLEDLAPAAPAARAANYWVDFGRQLATMHQHTNPQFGFDDDNYIGSTPQPNTWMVDGYAFFAEQRLIFQAELAAQHGLLRAGEVAQIEGLAGRLPELVPPQPASLSHGDLWSGNAISGPQGQPAMIDPAAHYGWAEAELAMTQLFGGFPAAFYDAYVEVNPLAVGWQARLPLYNLYHLLNHLNLFGRGYYGQVMQVVGRY